MRFLFFTTLATLIASVISQEVRVGSYSFDGLILNGDVTVRNLAFDKTVKVIYADSNKRFGTECGATYQSGPDSSNNELWTFTCVIGLTGISEFYVEYTVGGRKFFGNPNGPNTNYQVTVNVPPPPTTTPDATFLGFQSDITTWLSEATPFLKQYLFDNISPKSVPRALPGAIIASPTNVYIYHWIRDAGLVMDVVNTFYKNGDKNLESLFFDFQKFNNKIQNIRTLTGLGEVKFEVDGTAFNDPWCRPQHDGPALRASAFIRFAKAYLANGGDINRVRNMYNGTESVIKPDLEWVARNFADANGCDLWEEQRGLHFFTMAAQRRSMYEGKEIADIVGDAGAARFYENTAKTLDSRIQAFWNPSQASVQTTLNARLLDAAIPLGAIHGNNFDGVFAPEDDRVLSSIFALEAAFIPEYTLNRVRVDSAGRPLSVAVGRYSGDRYDGFNTNGRGNPWYLTTAAVAEVAYRATIAYVKNGSINVTPLNKRLFNSPAPAGLGLPNIPVGTYTRTAPEFKLIVDALIGYADRHLRRIRFHGAAGNRFNEQYNRDNGSSAGVADLTWSYASILTANFAREELRGLYGANATVAARR
ncbi:glycoside hydrolase 15 protein [Chytridiales sp. JEL 0842]|nr:glycoside hydrolase 15 protein [Chytridiales sp. JEL 0842]